MEREILFRAKHIHAMDSNEYLNGRQVHGYLSDKNGKKIWENDILMCNGNPDDLVKAVFGEFRVIDIITEQAVDTAIGWHYEVIPTDAISRCEPFCYPMPLNHQYVKRCEMKVIGNIYDNPELLGGTK